MKTPPSGADALDVAMSKACIHSWDQSQFTSGDCDAVHPMFSRAFEAGYRAALSAAQDAPVQAAQAVPEIDYEALIVAARAKNRNWTPGTNGCVAFKHGAEWFRSVVLASAPAAPQPATQHSAPVAWMDDGTLRAGSESTAFRVVTDETKRGMPASTAESFKTPLYLHPAQAQEAAPAAQEHSTVAANHKLYGGIVRAAINLLAACHEQHDTKPYPQCFGVPYGAVNALRDALEGNASAAPAAQGEPSDPLQGAANWLLEAIGGCNIRTLEWHLMIDFNRAERLMLAARAAQQKGASNG